MIYDTVVVVAVVIMEVITLIYCKPSRLGVTYKHTDAANVLHFTDREFCVTTPFIDFVMSQRVHITRMRVHVSARLCV